MKIKKLKLHNYRNLDGAEVLFEDNCNFIVGENNLGKTNLLSALNILFSSRAFRYEDFTNPENPIEISLQIKLADIEIGHFKDLFDVDDYTLITIVAKQNDFEDNIQFFHLESGVLVHPSTIKCLNFLHYDSLRNPLSEINFDKGKGVGRFLRNIISQYLIDHNLSDVEFLNETKIAGLLNVINGKISKIKSFKEYGILAGNDDDIENLLSKVIILKDGNGDGLSKTGYGVQFLLLVTLSILDKLHSIQSQRGERGLFEDENGKKSISLVLGLDEPEIHLHPYMQRSLIKYLNAVISNSNSDFSLLIKELFDIDSFIGQIIVVTHSPNIVLNNYKQVIRLYPELRKTKIKSGGEVILTASQEKHLLMQLAYIKEAFFSRCVIFVEGETEFSSIPEFAETLGVNFDDLGISIIQSGGTKSLEPLYLLASNFAIPAIAIRDRDDNPTAPTFANFYQTSKRDFEEELVNLIDLGKENRLREIVIEYDDLGESCLVQFGVLNNTIKKYNLALPNFTAAIKLKDIPLTNIPVLKCFYLSWLNKKTYTLGKTIGQTLAKDDIPAIYQQIILAAQILAKDE